MDFFKVITIIFMIVITYLLYSIYTEKNTIAENFESTPSLADD